MRRNGHFGGKKASFLFSRHACCHFEFGMGVNVIEDIFQEVLKMVETYGWFVVITAAVLYFSWPQIKAFQARKSLAEANDPRRKAVLDAQRLRVRLNQQKSLNGEE